MRYELVGRKIYYEGKTLWEIVGNLKNFGVGRLIKRSTKYVEPCFFKVLKVMPIPPLNRQFCGRRIVVWMEEVHRGVKEPVRLMAKNTEYPKFQLIPKSEEAEYWKKFEEYQKNFKPKIIPKYCEWPPLYELLWKMQKAVINGQRVPLPMPNLNTVVTKISLRKAELSTGDEKAPLCTTSFHKNDVPVEDMIKEIVKLKKFIKAKSCGTAE